MTAHIQHVGRRRPGYRGGLPTRQMGLTRLGDDPAPVIPALRAIPPACPWCHARCLRWAPGAPEVTCPTCGWAHLVALAP